MRIALDDDIEGRSQAPGDVDGRVAAVGDVHRAVGGEHQVAEEVATGDRRRDRPATQPAGREIEGEQRRPAAVVRDVSLLLRYGAGGGPQQSAARVHGEPEDRIEPVLPGGEEFAHPARPVHRDHPSLANARDQPSLPGGVPGDALGVEHRVRQAREHHARGSGAGRGAHPIGQGAEPGIAGEGGQGGIGFLPAAAVEHQGVERRERQRRPPGAGRESGQSQAVGTLGGPGGDRVLQAGEGGGAVAAAQRRGRGAGFGAGHLGRVGELRGRRSRGSQQRREQRGRSGTHPPGVPPRPRGTYR